MEFTVFVQKIKPIIGGADSTHLFTRKIFEEIITDEKSSLIEDISDSSFKSYYNGKNKITKISRKIFQYIEPEQFANYLDDLPDPTVQALCNVFQSDIPEINPHNAAEKIAYLFQEILITAASQKRKNTPKSASEANLINAIEKHPNETSPYSAEDQSLLQEFNSDFDELTLSLAGENLGTILLEGTIINNLTDLYESKWKDKTSEFTDPTLKSYIFGLLGEFHTLSTILSSNKNPYEIKNSQTKIQKLYIKLHPENFDIAYPHGAFIDDWDDI